MSTIDDVLREQSPDESVSALDYVLDPLRGVASGAAGFAQSIGSLADGAVELFGGDLIDDSWLSDDALPEWMKTRTLLGGLVSGATQFSLGFAGLGLGRLGGAIGNGIRSAKAVSALAGRAGLIGGATRLATSPYVAKSVLGGVLTDAFAFKGTEGRMSDLLVEMGGVANNPLTQWLATDENDSWAEARLKNAVDGIFGGLLFDGVAKSIGYGLKKGKIAAMTASGAVSEAEAKLLESGPLKRTTQELKGLRRLFQDGVNDGRLSDDVIERHLALRDLNLDDVAMKNRDTFIEQATKALGEAKPGEDASKVVRAGLVYSDAFAKLKAAATGEDVDTVYGSLFGEVSSAKGSGPRDALKQNNARGWTEFADDGQALISFTKNADASTFVHEMAHVFRRQMGTVDEGIDREVKTILGLSGEWDSAAGRQAEEKFARGFEKYVATGEAVNDSQAGAFAMFKNWLSSIYQGVMGSPLKEEFDPRLMQVFDVLVGGKSYNYRGLPSAARGVEESFGTALADTKVAAGEDVADALAESVAYHVNFDRLGVDRSVKDDLFLMAAKLNEQRATKVGGVKALSETVSGAAARYADAPADVVKDLRTASKSISGLDETMLAFRVLRNSLVIKTRSLASEVLKFGPGEIPEEIGRRFGSMQKNLEDLHLLGQEVQTYAARAVSSGRIAAGATIGEKEFKDALEVMLGNVENAKKAGSEASQAALEKTAQQVEAAGNKPLAETIRKRKATVPGVTETPKAPEPVKAEEKPATTPEAAPTDGTAPKAAEPAAATPKSSVPPDVAQKAEADKELLATAQIIRDSNIAGVDPVKMMSKRRQFREAGLIDAFAEYYKASIMSGIPTMTVNGISGAINTPLQAASRFLGAAVSGNGAEIKSASRTALNLAASFGDILKYTFMDASGVSNGPQGLRRVWNTIRNETPSMVVGTSNTEARRAIQASTFGLKDKSISGGVVNWLGGVVRMPFRVNQGLEEFFGQLNYLAYIRTKAADAADRALVGIKDDAARGAFIDNYIKDAFDLNGGAAISADGKKLLHADAAKYAQSVTYTQDLVYGLGQTIAEAKAKHPYLDLLVPFVKAPTNIMRQMVRMTPVLGQIQEAYQRRMMSRSTEEVMRARGEMLIGTAIWGTAIHLASSGQITGSGPVNAEERRALEATGWRPFSLVREDEDGKKTYIEYRRLDPFASILGIAADFADAAAHLGEDDRDYFGRAALLSIANNVTSRTYLQGMSEALKAIAQPDRNAGTFIQNRLGALIPNFIARIAGAEDDSVRETRSILDAMRRRIPGMADDLPPRRDIFGEAITPSSGWVPFTDSTEQGTVSNFIGRMASPAQFSREVDDGVKTELAGLQHGLSMPSKRIQGLDLTRYSSAGGQDAYDRLQQMLGDGTITRNGRTLKQAVAALIGSSSYQNLPRSRGPGDKAEERAKAVSSVIESYRSTARKRLLTEFPELRRDLQTLLQTR